MKKHVAYGYSYPISNSVGGALGGPEIKKQAYLASLASLTWDSGQKCSKNNFDTLTSPKHFWPKSHCGNFSKVTELKSKTWEHHQKAGLWELGSTIYHPTNPKIWQKKHILSPVVVLVSPDLCISGTFCAPWSPWWILGCSSKHGFPFFQKLKLSRSWIFRW